MTVARTAARTAAGAALAADLAAVVGDRHCLTDPDLLSSYCTDWTGRFTGTADAVVRPGTTEEVRAVLAVLGRRGAVAIAQGGNTGLVGGSVPRVLAGDDRLQVVLSTRRLDSVFAMSPSDRLLDIGAGATLATAHEAARAVGCHLGIDLAARDSATIGGMVATNAGGLQVLRYGTMRRRIAGIEAVLGDGTVVAEMSGLGKDSLGLDLPSLLVGSEGTIGVVTRALVRLEPEAVHRVAVLAAFASVEDAVALVEERLRSVRALESAELTLVDGMQLVCAHAGLPEPPGLGAGATAWLTVEAAGPTDPTEDLAAQFDDPRVVEVAVASSEADRRRLWAYRERHTEAVSSLGVPHKLDVATKPRRLPELISRLPEAVAAAAPRARTIIWGHVADGNVHVNVLGPPPGDDSVDDAVLGLVVDLGGSISAEHGIGIAKRHWLTRARPPGTLELMRRVRRAADPGRILNPGVLEPE